MSRAERGADVAAAYDRWSRSYETMENATRDLAGVVLRRASLELRGQEVLEVGCGTGLNTRYLAEQARRVVAFDFSAGMLERARAGVGAANVRFVRADITGAWPAGEASFDVVVCTLVLEHVADLRHVFREAARVLRAGGEFFVCELHPFRQMRGGQAQFADEASGEVVLVPAHLHDVSDYVNAAVGAGFELLHLGEWRDETPEANPALNAPPRLLSLHVRARR